MLGYLTGEFTTRSRFGSVPSIFAMDNVRCKGDESTLLDCPHLTKDDCGGHEGAGAICSNSGDIGRFFLTGPPDKNANIGPNLAVFSFDFH